MLIEMISAIGAGLIVGMAAGSGYARSRYRERLAAYSAALNRTRCELAAAERQITAADLIYNRFQQRLTNQFTSLPDEDEDEPDTADTLKTDRIPIIRRDGVLTYETY